MQWFECEKELPIQDGKYLISNDVDPFNYPLGMRGIAYYDGYGFNYDGIYREPKYWTYYNEPEKKYGKQS